MNIVKLAEQYSKFRNGHSVSFDHVQCMLLLEIVEKLERLDDIKELLEKIANTDPKK